MELWETSQEIATNFANFQVVDSVFVTNTFQLESLRDDGLRYVPLELFGSPLSNRFPRSCFWIREMKLLHFSDDLIDPQQ